MAAKRTLRSREWYGKADKDGFAHRSWMKNQGLPDHVFDGRPIEAHVVNKEVLR